MMAMASLVLLTAIRGWAVPPGVLQEPVERVNRQDPDFGIQHYQLKGEVFKLSCNIRTREGSLSGSREIEEAASSAVIPVHATIWVSNCVMRPCRSCYSQ